MVNFGQEKPPALLIGHAPKKPKNFDIIDECLKEKNNQEGKDYAKAVKCIDKNLKNETEILFEEADNITKEYMKDSTILKFG